MATNINGNRERRPRDADAKRNRESRTVLCTLLFVAGPPVIIGLIASLIVWNYDALRELLATFLQPSFWLN
ncbi:MAG: hypothetical protein V4459_07070 [Pseudomonadota bacterium]